MKDLACSILLVLLGPASVPSMSKTQLPFLEMAGRQSARNFDQNFAALLRYKFDQLSVTLRGRIHYDIFVGKFWLDPRVCCVLILSLPTQWYKVGSTCFLRYIHLVLLVSGGTIVLVINLSPAFTIQNLLTIRRIVTVSSKQFSGNP